MAALLPLGHNPRVAEPLCALSLLRSELLTAAPGQHMAKEKCSSQRGVKNIDLVFCFVLFSFKQHSLNLLLSSYHLLQTCPKTQQGDGGLWNQHRHARCFPYEIAIPFLHFFLNGHLFLALVWEIHHRDLFKDTVSSASTLSAPIFSWLLGILLRFILFYYFFKHLLYPRTLNSSIQNS